MSTDASALAFASTAQLISELHNRAIASVIILEVEKKNDTKSSACRFYWNGGPSVALGLLQRCHNLVNKIATDADTVMLEGDDDLEGTEGGF